MADVDLKTLATNFNKDYFLNYEMGNWKQIKSYGINVPEIVRRAVLQAQGYENIILFKKIMEDISNA